MPFPVVFVCIGNVCRSPLMERLLRLRLSKLGVAEHFAVTSAGVRSMRARPMHPESVRTLHARGGSEEGFVARDFTEGIARGSGLVLAATRDIRSTLLEESPRALRRSFTLTEFVALAESQREKQRDAREVAEGGSVPERLASLVEQCSRERSSLTLQEYDIPDPMGQTPETFDRVATAIEAQIDQLALILAAEVRSE